jgi:hypothetical protein
MMDESGAEEEIVSDELQRWADAYAEAWRAGDAEAAANLFTEDCVFRSHPFRELEDARVYTRRVFGSERERDVWFGTALGSGSRGAVEYWAAMVEDDQDVTLAGCCVIELDSDGRCRTLRDYWAMQPGRSGPPAGWGR